MTRRTHPLTTARRWTTGAMLAATAVSTGLGLHLAQDHGTATAAGHSSTGGSSTTGSPSTSATPATSYTTS